jgi:hypothetical protein
MIGGGSEIAARDGAPDAENEGAVRERPQTAVHEPCIK